MQRSRISPDSFQYLIEFYTSMNCFRVSEAQALEFKARIRASPCYVPAPHERTSADTPARSEKQNGIGGKASGIPVPTGTGKASNMILNLAPFVKQIKSNSQISCKLQLCDVIHD